MTVPEKIYLTRKEVLAVVGGRRQLEKLEAAGRLTRRRLPGYTWAHYEHAEVRAINESLTVPGVKAVERA